jgi:hypothetical protein
VAAARLDVSFVVGWRTVVGLRLRTVAARRPLGEPRYALWLVLTAALVTLGLGYGVSESAQRGRDARLFLISLAFIASFGFLALHALATPDVLLGKNACSNSRLRWDWSSRARSPRRPHGS